MTERVQVAIKELYDIRRDIRCEAAARLASYGEEAVPALIDIVKRADKGEGLNGYFRRLDETEAEKRTWRLALEALQQIGEPAIEPLSNLAQGAGKRVKELVVPLLSAQLEQNPCSTIDSSIYDAMKYNRLKLFHSLCWNAVACFCSAFLALGLLSSNRHTASIIAGFFFVRVVLVLRDIYLIAMRLRVIAKVGKASSNLATLLASALAEKNPVKRFSLHLALIKILPTLKASDKIAASEMNLLIMAIDRKNPDLTRAILKALEQVGDERALSRVERLISELQRVRKSLRYRLAVAAQRYNTLPRAFVNQTRELLAAAEASLPYLKHRAELAVYSKTLLRASTEMGVEANAILLRPAHASNASDGSELLRAAVATGKE